MAEYIERETAIAWFMPYAHAGESIDADVVISDIKGMKSADVAPVVRCKNCVHYDLGVCLKIYSDWHFVFVALSQFGRHSSNFVIVNAILVE